jgi:stage II sporulation protein D
MRQGLAGRVAVAGLLLFLLYLPQGCTSQTQQESVAHAPMVRVRLAEGVRTVTVTSTEPALYRVGDEPVGRRLALPSAGATVSLERGAWKIGNMALPPGELMIQPARVGSVAVNNQQYRGRYRLVPVSANTFDVINDVDVEGYLKSVVPKELPRTWNEETFKAQAVVARTYVLYECKTAPQGRYWDVYDDQRSQMYGGIAAESTKSQEAVDATSGVVVAYGPPGQERIFHAYYSSCCGGVTQSVTDAFPRETYIEPLSDQNNGSLCNASPRFNWGPVVVRKDELTRRFRLFGQRRNGPEKNMAQVARIQIDAVNRFGRPVRFRVVDIKGNQYSWSGEEIRWAVNTDAPAGQRLYSSFFKLIDEPEAVHFVEGHGLGHGVGMCQWCAERRAEEGMRHEDIVLSAFPRARLIRAY